jgi:hypothetical protein
MYKFTLCRRLDFVIPGAEGVTSRQHTEPHRRPRKPRNAKQRRIPNDHLRKPWLGAVHELSRAGQVADGTGLVTVLTLGVS